MGDAGGVWMVKKLDYYSVVVGTWLLDWNMWVYIHCSNVNMDRIAVKETVRCCDLRDICRMIMRRIGILEVAFALFSRVNHSHPLSTHLAYKAKKAARINISCMMHRRNSTKDLDQPNHTNVLPKTV